MTLDACIKSVDEIKPNAFSNDTKTQWLNEVEGMVQTEVFLMNPVGCVQYTYDNDKDATLLVDPPHDKLYPAYLEAKIDYANGEYNKYQNTMQMFNSFYSEFMRWYAQTWRPADACEEGLL